jgi:hypothetical protein
MHLFAPMFCLLVTLSCASPLFAAEPRSYTEGNFALELDGAKAGMVRSIYARYSGGQSIGTEQLRSYLHHMQADGWDRARVEREIIASLPTRRVIPAQPNMRVRCTGKPLRCGSVPAAGEKDTQNAPKP